MNALFKQAKKFVVLPVAILVALGLVACKKDEAPKQVPAQEPAKVEQQGTQLQKLSPEAEKKLRESFGMQTPDASKVKTEEQTLNIPTRRTAEQIKKADEERRGWMKDLQTRRGGPS
jgi:hypothetical protein